MDDELSVFNLYEGDTGPLGTLCVPEIPFQPRSPPLPLRPLQGLPSHPGQSPMCLVQEPPALQSPAEGTPLPWTRCQWLLSPPPSLPVCDYQEQRTCHHPSAPGVPVGQSAPAHLALSHLGSGSQIFKDQNQQKHKEWNKQTKKSLKKRKKPIKKTIKIKNFQRITIYFINLRIYYINIYPSSRISLPPLTLVMKT